MATARDIQLNPSNYATVFNPTSGDRRAVKVGDPNAFAGGYMLETPTQNLQTYSQNPTREILKAPAGPDLYARDNANNTTVKIGGDSGISPLVHSGYQDSRRVMDLGTGAATGSTQPPINPQDSWNAAIADLLRKNQQGGSQQQTQQQPATLDADLLAQRNALINSIFNGVNDMTPENLRMLTPEQKSALRNQNQRGMQDQLAAIDTTLQSRKLARAETLAQQQQALAQQKADQAAADAQMTPDMKEYAYAQSQGYAGSWTDYQKEAANLKNGNQYAPGSIGEYQFYAEQENAAGRQPVSFSDYQTQDANRKALASSLAGSNGLTPQQTQNFLTITNKYQADTVVKQGVQANGIMQIADQVIANPTNAGNQLKALYTLVKALDPNSAVREGEISLAEKTQSYISKWETDLNRITTGAVIAPNIATELAQATKELAGTWQSIANDRNKQYQSQAQVTGVGDAFKQYQGGYDSNFGSSSSSSGQNGNSDALDTALDKVVFTSP